MKSRRPAKRSQAVEWLTPTLNGGPVTIRWPTEDGPWLISTHWAVVDGRAVMVGLDVRSFVDPSPRGSSERAPAAPGGLVEVTQKVLRGLPISSIREGARRMLLELSGGGALIERVFVGAGADEATAWHEAAAGALTAKGTPRRRRPPATEALLDRVTDLYRAAVAEGSKTPALYVEQHLRAEGLYLPDNSSARNRVRKLIQRARDRARERDLEFPPR